MAKTLIDSHMNSPGISHRGKNSPILSLIQQRPILLKKRPILLLEVMIAIALIVMAAIPLIYPHIYMLHAQRYFLEKVELDNVVNLHFVDVMEQLYLNKISWGAVVNEEEFSFSDDIWDRMGYKKHFPFKGSYRFKVKHQKPKGESGSPLTLYLLDLDYSFYPKEQSSNTNNGLNYHYNLFVVRDLGDGHLSQGNTEEENTEEDGEAGQ